MGYTHLGQNYGLPIAIEVCLRIQELYYCSFCLPTRIGSALFIIPVHYSYHTQSITFHTLLLSLYVVFPSVQKITIDSSFSRKCSSLSHHPAFPFLLSYHVKSLPLCPKSFNPASSKASKNLFIWDALLSFMPFFSCVFQSPPYNYGKFLPWLNLLKSCHELLSHSAHGCPQNL